MGTAVVSLTGCWRGALKVHQRVSLALVLQEFRIFRPFEALRIPDYSVCERGIEAVWMDGWRMMIER